MKYDKFGSNYVLIKQAAIAIATYWVNANWKGLASSSLTILYLTEWEIGSFYQLHGLPVAKH